MLCGHLAFVAAISYWLTCDPGSGVRAEVSALLDPPVGPQWPLVPQPVRPCTQLPGGMGHRLHPSWTPLPAYNSSEIDTQSPRQKDNLPKVEKKFKKKHDNGWNTCVAIVYKLFLTSLEWPIRLFVLLTMASRNIGHWSLTPRWNNPSRPIEFICLTWIHLCWNLEKGV